MLYRTIYTSVRSIACMDVDECPHRLERSVVLRDMIFFAVLKFQRIQVSARCCGEARSICHCWRTGVLNGLKRFKYGMPIPCARLRVLSLCTSYNGAGFGPHLFESLRPMASPQLFYEYDIIIAGGTFKRP